MSALAVFEVAESTRLGAPLLVARHMRRHPLLPDPNTITVDRVWQCVRVQLSARTGRRGAAHGGWQLADRQYPGPDRRRVAGRGVHRLLGHDEALFTPLVEPDAGGR